MIAQQSPWYEVAEIDSIDSPALLIYLERVKQNIATAIKMVGDPMRLRPHVKTHKSPALTQLMLNAGITKFKCATIAEAEMLGSVGAPDVLLAYQPIGPKLQRFVSLQKHFHGTQFSCLLDDVTIATELNRQAEIEGIRVNVFVDVNVGMNRTGVQLGALALQLIEAIGKLPALKILGLHVYDGHINDSDLEQRTRRCNDAFELITPLKEAVVREGVKNPIIVAGGSPTFPVHAKRTNVECSPGTFVYWDAGYSDTFPDQAFLPAALVLSRIVSQPAANLFCCDLGHKAVAAENPLPKRVRFLNAPDLVITGQSEEHLLLQSSAEKTCAIGDVLYGMPLHICPTCALYEKAIVIEDGAVKEEWRTTARDRKITL